MKVTKSEHNLLAAVTFVEHGEINEVELPEEDATLEWPTSKTNCRVLDYLRNMGIVFVDKIFVHDKEIKQIQFFGEYRGIRYIKKILF